MIWNFPEVHMAGADLEMQKIKECTYIIIRVTGDAAY